LPRWFFVSSGPANPEKQFSGERKNDMNPLIQLKTTTSPLFIAFALLCLGLLPGAEAVVPPPDGGYPGFNTAEGTNALKNLTTGTGNTAAGWYSLFTNSTGSFNTAVGAGTLLLNTSVENTAAGAGALLSNTTGNRNTASGAFALLNNATGFNNTATGANALLSNTAGNNNTATGLNALLANTTGNSNTANGAFALFDNTTGNNNTANGVNALRSNTTGANSTATGENALGANTTGNSNTANGYFALSSNSAGGNNVAIGNSALDNNTTGVGNTALGFGAGDTQTTGSNNVYIGSGMSGVAGENDSCYIRSIFGQTSAGGNQVFINNNNKLGTMTSSKRFKKDICPMDKASETLFSLKPVLFRYKKEIDLAGTSQFGLVAEDVEKVNPDLVVRDKEGKPYSVRYDQVNAMLLNEFLKEHREVQELKKQVAALTAGLQKVSAQLEASKPAPQVVKNNQ
jgi:trimeric autotransporter adhesin